MKKSILLLTAGLVAGITSNGQQATSMLQSSQSTDVPQTTKAGKSVAVTNIAENRSGARTTVGGPGGSRWFDYSGTYFYGLLDARQSAVGGDLNYYSPAMWNDSTALIGYTGTVTGSLAPYRFNGLISIAQSLDPTYGEWNNTDATGIMDFTGLIGITPYDTYSIDSLLIPGWYTRSDDPSKASVVDTLIVTLIQGSGATGTDLSPGSLTGSVVPLYCSSCTALNYYEVWHDIANNRGAHNGGTALPSSQVYKFLLTNADSNANAFKNPRFPRFTGDGGFTAPFAVSAGNKVAMTVTFKSGDLSYAPTGGHPGDTLRISNGTSITRTKYSYWEPQVYYCVTTSGSTTPTWNWYDPANRATSYFENVANGWGGPVNEYYPNWNIITGSTTTPQPASAQVVHLGFHTVCAACQVLPFTSLNTAEVKNISNVKAVPNPANNKLSVTFTANSAATVTLTNVLGQIVATQSVTNGKVEFNTTELPAGVYVYSIDANGENATGRVVVAH